MKIYTVDVNYGNVLIDKFIVIAANERLAIKCVANSARYPDWNNIKFSKTNIAKATEIGKYTGKEKITESRLLAQVY